MRGERTHEKERFYNSSAWRKLAKHYASSKNWTCEKCKNKNINHAKPLYQQLHCHHKKALTDANISDPNIALNADNLILLCRVCHNVAHGDDNEVVADGLYFDKNGMIRKH